MPLRELSDRKRLIGLVLIMVGVATVMASVWGWGLYLTAVDEQKSWLQKLVQSQARMIEDVAQYDFEHARQHQEQNSRSDIIRKIAEGKSSFIEFGETGEFVLGRREGDMIVFLLKQKHGENKIPEPIPFDSTLAVPMHHALLSHSGTIMGLDYRNEEVLAAYEPIKGLDIGIVAKVDLAEVRAPFVKVAIYSGFSALFIIAVGGLLTHRISMPMLRRLEDSIVTLRDAQQDTSKIFQAIESSSVLVMVSDPNGIIEYINPAFSHVTGYSKDEMLGQRPGILKSEHTTQEGYAELWETIKSGHVWKGEFKNKCKDGSVFWALTTISPVIIDGKIINFTCIQEDITERKEAEQKLALRSEELARSNQDLEQFAYVASHDLQEPLRAVASYTQLLAKRYEGQLDEKADKYIRYAHDGAVRMQKLIEGLLMFSRINTKGDAFSLVDCNSAVDTSLKNMALAIEESKATIVVDDLPSLVGDERQLMMVFQNLISNAIKFRTEAPPKIEISATRKGKDWRFCVADNGIGMDPEFSKRIFTIFQRLHIRSKYPGEGLGLAICKQVAERHGGTIWVESFPSKGAAFYFTISTEKLGTKNEQPAARN